MSDLGTYSSTPATHSAADPRGRRAWALKVVNVPSKLRKVVYAAWLRRNSHTRKRPQAAIVSITRDLVIVLGIYAYFVGWTYAYFYYEAFDIRLYSLGLPVYYFVVFAFPVLYHAEGIITVLTAVSLLLFSSRFRNRFLVLIILMSLFPCLFYLARSEGEHAAINAQFDTGDNNRIELLFSNGQDAHYPEDLQVNNDMDRLRLLIDTPDRIIAYYQPPRVGKTTPFLLVYDIQKKDITTVKHLVR